MSRGAATEQDRAMRELVATASNVLGVEDLGDFTLGHVSVRDAQGRGVWMKAAGWGFEEVTPERVLLVGWEGEVLAGEGRRHVEYPIHTELMRARPEVHSVVHAHAPHAVAFAALGAIFVPPDVARFTQTGDLITTPALGRALAAAVGGRNAALMVHHGIVTAGATVPEAVAAAILLERACRKQLLAMAAGALRTWSSDEEALAKRGHVYAPEMIWTYLVRKVRTSQRREVD
jgi:L-fuculose-phosphate aldolase